MKTIYIAGKVTGEPREQCFEKFQNAEIMLRSKGFKVVNAMKIVDPHTDWQTAMRICIADIVTKCDAMFMLPDWESSKGARLEKKIAEGLELEILNHSNFTV